MQPNNKLFMKVGKIYDYIIERPIITSAVLLGILSIIVIGFSLPYYVTKFDNMKYDLLIQGHGMMFDIALIGMLLYWLNQNGEKRSRIRTYQDEIDDFRLWESAEAAFRTVGNLKRLNRHGIYDVNLVNCYLCNTNINYINLKGSNLNSANISNTSMIDVILENARLNQTNFENSNLNHANMKGSYASGAIFKDAFLIKADFQNSFLIKTNFNGAFLMEANLRNSYLMGADFENASLYKADFRDVKGLTIDQIKGAKTLFLAKFDDDFIKQNQDFFNNLID